MNEVAVVTGGFIGQGSRQCSISTALSQMFLIKYSFFDKIPVKMFQHA